MHVFSGIPQAIDALRDGNFVIVVDDEDRENEGDIVIAADHITAEKMAFIIRHTGGVVCLPMSNTIADSLDLPPMVMRNTSKYSTPFTVSIEAAEGVTTGISAEDRAHTIRTAISTVAKPEDLRRPGHIFPLRAEDGGVMVRAGHTEASVDLCRLAGLREAAVLSELMHDDGTMMRLPALTAFAKQFDIPLISIADLIALRNRNETFVRREAESDLESDTGMWKLIVYSDALHNHEHVALIKGEVSGTQPTLVRVHSECLTGDVFGSCHCDCGAQLGLAMDMMEAEGKGVLLYLRQEGRGIGLANKIRAYALQQKGFDTVEANEELGLPTDLRQYGIGAQILKDIGLCNIRLLTNNPKKIAGLNGYGLHVVEQLPLEIKNLSEKQKKYLETKKRKLGHWITRV
ncbi:bifunctional 3,4-dihydroxy-2-butanone-4-phosphate synthase/GTP cyclohydrolase II [Candidatus Peregrinibacteria bacterium CG10_big_fil_rev_8_21_14_0_10_49_24]|nr:MAG: bifunctional 3,4-dihydroxy-2-butanone-4-phosphate synthase/GTP cyclohydrolase II [Candidatus Peregrinibacteria bacterium CG11_big_fil_rev_8_21_14_0_20_49_14]PIR51396.1 MAG: bifunctional 3,4-dihydroxy-2-butanone-4-phosphate synthase/GTP cyclohydrolase II [Candidatus Peregrinibacteria bacterium CG10_big_fil_rev_8_21_14_0_10_49_24]PJA68160.1 MAG: bifunctional 3,4-dihydroxy-2-butanone-4-phosphate synthase/GTP cyclohydrolase II [Candidatus Peregrinibacteria bacterium CG_4_9_14_3_um_filter_49_1